jgi:hypothetical protein
MTEETSSFWMMMAGQCTSAGSQVAPMYLYWSDAIDCLLSPSGEHLAGGESNAGT